ncbi:glycosyltransferase family 2 protein [Sphingomonas montanisoli]|uniref:Glycosyltransferase family 2 protein n=1 Tax=Sphingomonas montanisoli TaxID=2606412 RepID=A0A5D9CCZ7_9SPHN|nr:glycosyltransferase family A protein [Sphingomonas montanisoli]TZG28021.1 glycosyltransferase family 2 protein [Sphingomonas montanisoli]
MGEATTALIVIGRNEGERLERCLRSIGVGRPVIYVDSGSTDDSVVLAERLGATVVRLDPAQTFTAARARNAGLARLAEDGIRVDHVQMIDGDCELQPGWIERAVAAMEADPALAVVFGRRRERFPDRSIYNWLCNVEWAIPPGPAGSCGGDALFRHKAIAAAGGYRPEMIAGEEPDLCARLRRAGWEIVCLDAEMTLHDAAITRFGQWWRRTARAGHAFAELTALHGKLREGRPYRAARRRIVMWGLLPVLGLLLAAAIGLAGQASDARMIALAILLLLAAQTLRLTLREGLRFPMAKAFALASFLTIGKFAEATGLIRYLWEQASGRRATLIEYKNAA